MIDGTGEKLGASRKAFIDARAFDYFCSIQQECKERVETLRGNALRTETRILADAMASAWRLGYEARMKDEVRERAESGVDKDGH